MLDQEKKTAPAPGRPRSDQSHHAILQATREILEQEGYRAMTIEGIAARAGVSKKTIYRWWPSKSAVALEALAAYTGEEVPFPDTGSLDRDLLTYFEQSIEGLQGASGEMLRGLASEAQLDPAFAQEFQRTFIVPRKDDLIVLLQRG